jgi:serine protease Do
MIRILTRMRTGLSVLVFIAGLSPTLSLAAEEESELAAMFAERQKAVVAVEFFVQFEIERRAQMAIGVVFDDEGRIVMLENAVPNWLPADRFKDFKIRPLGQDIEGFTGEYLGQDYLTGHHFVQVEPAGRAALRSIRDFGWRTAEIGDALWGIGIMTKHWDYKPYLLGAQLSMTSQLPWEVGFTDRAVAHPGSVVFDAAGKFVGRAGGPSTDDYTFFMSGEQYNVGLQANRESSVLLMAEPFFKYLDRVPTEVSGDPRPWIGVSGLQPIDREVALYLGLENQGALVVSDVIAESPAQTAGLQGKDIIVALKGEPLHKFRPDFVVSRYFEQWLMKQAIGVPFTLTVIRGDEEKQLEITPSDEPLPLRKAQRAYFKRLGVAIREFTLFDGIHRRIMKVASDGVIAEFVKPNSPVNAAGLQTGDWIKKIDDQPIATYAEAEAMLQAIADDAARSDCVLLISRNNETKVLRVKLQ